MHFPRALRKQLVEYEKAGFTITDVMPRSGSHFMLTFAEFPQPQIISKNSSAEPRAIKNNVSMYRRLATECRKRNEKA